MTGFGQKLEQKLLPVAAKLGANKGLIAIRDGMILATPLIIVGSIFMIVASFPIEVFQDFLNNLGVTDYLWKGVDSSFNLVALIASFGIAHSFANSYGIDGIAAGVISISSFITVTPFISNEENVSGLTLGYLGGKGVFVAIVVGLITAFIYQVFINKNIKITLPESVPPAISRSFSAVIPGIFIISMWLLVFGILDKFDLPNLHDIIQALLARPLSLVGTTLIGTMFVTGLNSLFWFLGIHGGSTVNAIFAPTWLENLTINANLKQSGEPLTEIVTSPFMDNFVWLGGGGATLGLVLVIGYIAARRNASQQTKSMAPITVTPGLFNINEPTIFGLPIVMNLTLVIPFILAPMVNTLIAYFAFSTGLVPLTYASATWTMPPIISGFLVTGSIRGSLLQVVLIVIDILLYLPFYLMLEKRNREEENKL